MEIWVCDFSDPFQTNRTRSKQIRVFAGPNQPPMDLKGIQIPAFTEECYPTMLMGSPRSSSFTVRSKIVLVLKIRLSIHV